MVVFARIGESPMIMGRYENWNIGVEERRGVNSNEVSMMVHNQR